MSDVSLGYVILFVKDVSATLSFYEEAFGLTRRLFMDNDGKAYGELETGATRLAFASLSLANKDVVTTTPERPPLSFEVAFTTADVPALYAQAQKAGAIAVSEPEVKPWGQLVAYVRDKDGHLVEICTPMP
jgi:lactoylglutathione lyase